MRDSSTNPITNLLMGRDAERDAEKVSVLRSSCEDDDISWCWKLSEYLEELLDNIFFEWDAPVQMGPLDAWDSWADEFGGPHNVVDPDDITYLYALTEDLLSMFDDVCHFFGYYAYDAGDALVVAPRTGD